MMSTKNHCTASECETATKAWHQEKKKTGRKVIVLMTRASSGTRWQLAEQ
jgi:hypothetical protein